MISSLTGEPFEPVVESDLDFTLSLQDWRLFPSIDGCCDIVVNVLKSSHEATQCEFFVAAFHLVSQLTPMIFKRVKIHYLINKDIRDQDLIPRDVVNWLLSSHIHIIYSHPHQGIIAEGYKEFNPWNAKGLEGELMRLCDHVGFPQGNNLKCPIFLQNKCAYGFGIPEYFIPSLVVPFDIDIEDPSIQKQILKFCKDNDDDAQWLWKKPYTTNQMYSVTSLDKVITEFRRLKERWQFMIPYLFLQPCLQNRMEYNVVCLNGVAIYEASIGNRKKSRVGRLKFSNRAARKQFAEKVISTLLKRRPESLVSGLFRVDVMWCSYMNKMIVLELESLEAAHFAETKDLSIESQMHAYLSVYHANNIVECINNLLKTKIPSLHYPMVNISERYNVY